MARKHPGKADAPAEVDPADPQTLIVPLLAEGRGVVLRLGREGVWICVKGAAAARGRREVSCEGPVEHEEGKLRAHKAFR